MGTSGMYKGAGITVFTVALFVKDLKGNPKISINKEMWKETMV